MTFETVPVVHLEARRLPEYPDAPAEAVLTRLARRYGRVVVVDAEGVRANDADLEFLQKAARKRSLWVDAGSRYATDAMDLFVAGAEAVTMRWNTLRSPEELEEAADLAHQDALFVALEYPGGRFLPHPKDDRDAADVVALADRLGVGVVFIVDHPDERLLRSLPGSVMPRFLHGKAEPSTLQELAFAGALVGPVDVPEATA